MNDIDTMKATRERADIAMLRVGEYGSACCVKDDRIHWLCSISEASTWRAVVAPPHRVPVSAIAELIPSRFGLTLVTKSGVLWVWDRNVGGQWREAGSIVEAAK